MLYRRACELGFRTRRVMEQHSALIVRGGGSQNESGSLVALSPAYVGQVLQAPTDEYAGAVLQSPEAATSAAALAILRRYLAAKPPESVSSAHATALERCVGIAPAPARLAALVCGWRGAHYTRCGDALNAQSSFDQGIAHAESRSPAAACGAGYTPAEMWLRAGSLATGLATSASGKSLPSTVTRAAAATVVGRVLEIALADAPADSAPALGTGATPNPAAAAAAVADTANVPLAAPILTDATRRNQLLSIAGRLAATVTGATSGSSSSSSPSVATVGATAIARFLTCRATFQTVCYARAPTLPQLRVTIAFSHGRMGARAPFGVTIQRVQAKIRFMRDSKASDANSTSEFSATIDVTSAATSNTLGGSEFTQRLMTRSDAARWVGFSSAASAPLLPADAVAVAVESLIVSVAPFTEAAARSSGGSAESAGSIVSFPVTLPVAGFDHAWTALRARVGMLPTLQAQAAQVMQPLLPPSVDSRVAPAPHAAFPGFWVIASRPALALTVLSELTPADAAARKSGRPIPSKTSGTTGASKSTSSVPAHVAALEGEDFAVAFELKASRGFRVDNIVISAAFCRDVLDFSPASEEGPHDRASVSRNLLLAADKGDAASRTRTSATTADGVIDTAEGCEWVELSAPSEAASYSMRLVAPGGADGAAAGLADGGRRVYCVWVRCHRAGKFRLPIRVEYTATPTAVPAAAPGAHQGTRNVLKAFVYVHVTMPLFTRTCVRRAPTAAMLLPPPVSAASGGTAAASGGDVKAFPGTADAYGGCAAVEFPAPSLLTGNLAASSYPIAGGAAGGAAATRDADVCVFIECNEMPIGSIAPDGRATSAASGHGDTGGGHGAGNMSEATDVWHEVLPVPAAMVASPMMAFPAYRLYTASLRQEFSTVASRIVPLNVLSGERLLLTCTVTNNESFPIVLHSLRAAPIEGATRRVRIESIFGCGSDETPSLFPVVLGVDEAFTATVVATVEQLTMEERATLDESRHREIQRLLFASQQQQAGGAGGRTATAGGNLAVSTQGNTAASLILDADQDYVHDGVDLGAAVFVVSRLLPQFPEWLLESYPPAVRRYLLRGSNSSKEAALSSVADDHDGGEDVHRHYASKADPTAAVMAPSPQFIEYTTSLPAAARVAEPRMHLRVAWPPQVSVLQPFPVVLRLFNPRLVVQRVLVQICPSHVLSGDSSSTLLGNNPPTTAESNNASPTGALAAATGGTWQRQYAAVAEGGVQSAIVPVGRVRFVESVPAGGSIDIKLTMLPTLMGMCALPALDVRVLSSDSAAAAHGPSFANSMPALLTQLASPADVRSVFVGPSPR
jgi:hypothetical protein